MSARQFREKGGSRVTAPTLLVCVGVESRPATFTDRTDARPDVLSRVHVASSRRIGRRFTKPDHFTHQGHRSFWDQMAEFGRDAGRVYVVAPVASDALTLLRFWDGVESGEFRIGQHAKPPQHGEDGKDQRRPVVNLPLVLHGRPDIIGYSHCGHSFKWVSVTNWADCSLVDMAKQVGYTLPALVDPLTRWEYPTLPAEDQATVVMLYMQRLIGWWLSIGGGMWKDTPGAAAYSTYKLRQNGTQVVRHEDPAALKLENAATFGGRSFVNFFGPIGTEADWQGKPSAPYYPNVGLPVREPVVRYDTRAMYPTLMRDRLFPVALVGVHGPKSVKWLEGTLRHLGAIAAVRVRSDRGELPCRVKGEVQYPVGQFDTTLTTPELLDALGRGEVVRVWAATTYTMGPAFRQWAEWVLALRTEQKRLGDKVGELVVKSLANALGGRLGRVRVRWEDAPDVAPRVLWGEWCLDDGSTPEPRLLRSICGRVQERITDFTRPGTLGACYAHLTAYGRQWMAAVRAPLGRRGVLWQDTDGILIPSRYDTHPEIAKRSGVGVFGLLERECVYTAGRFLTARHYWLDGRWVLAGVHDGFQVDDGMTATEVVSANPVRSAVEPINASILRAVRHINLSDIDPGVTVGADGWAVPPRRWVGEKRSPDPEALPTLFG